MGVLLMCLTGLLVTVAVFQRNICGWIANALLKLFLSRKHIGSGRRRTQHGATTKTGNGRQSSTSHPKPTLASVTFQSISLRCFFRGVELRYSNGVIVRIGRLSFGLRRLKQMILRQPLQKGKGKAIVVTIENARVSLPASSLSSSGRQKALESGDNDECSANTDPAAPEKAIRLPAAALLCARFVAIEVCDLRVESGVERPAACRSGQESPATESDGDAADDNPCAAAGRAAFLGADGVRTMEITGIRFVGFVSKQSSGLTVSLSFRQIEVIEHAGEATARGRSRRDAAHARLKRQLQRKGGSTLPSESRGPAVASVAPTISTVLDNLSVALVVDCYHTASQGSLYGGFTVPGFQRFKERQLQGLQSLAISLGRIDASADLSWFDDLLESGRRAKGLRSQEKEGVLSHPVWRESPPGVDEANRKHQCDDCQSPFEEAASQARENTDGDASDKAAEHGKDRGIRRRNIHTAADSSGRGVKGSVADGQNSRRTTGGKVYRQARGASQALGCSQAGGEDEPGGSPTADKANATDLACESSSSTEHPPAQTEPAAAAAVAEPPEGGPPLKPSECANPPSPGGFGLAMDARLVPARASLSVGAFVFVCSDDRMNEDGQSCSSSTAAAAGLGSVGLGKLEISSSGYEISGDFPSVSSIAETTKPKAPLEKNAVDLVWETLDKAASADDTAMASTPLSPPPKLGSAKLKLARFVNKCRKRNSVGHSVPTGGHGSMHLDKVLIRCRPSEGVGDGTEQSPTSEPCVVVFRDISAVPTVIVARNQPKGGKQHPTQPPGEAPLPPPLPLRPRPPLPTSSPLLLRRRPKRLFQIPSSFRRWLWRRALPRPPPRSGAHPNVSKLHITEVAVHVRAVEGKVDDRLAGWLNLRGLREADAVSATEVRIAKLISVGQPPTAGSQTYGPRKSVTIDTVRVSVQEVLDGAPDFGGQSEEREGKDGSGGNTRQRGRGRGRGRFDFEADDVRIQQEQVRHAGKNGRTPISCDKLFRELGGARPDSIVPAYDTCLSVECSRASVALVDKLPPICTVSGTVAWSKPYGVDSPGPSCSPPPPPPSDVDSDDNADGQTFDPEGALREGRRGESVTQGITDECGENKSGEDGETVARGYRLELDICGLCVKKVVEKGALGRTSRSSMAVACKEISASETVGDEYCGRIANLTGFSFTQVRLASPQRAGPVPPTHGTCIASTTTLDPQPVTVAAAGDTRAAGGGRVGETEVDVEGPPGATGTEIGEGLGTAAAAEGKTATRPLPSRVGSGALKADEIVIDRTSMAWSGSVHCMLVRLSQRLVSTIDHLVGLPPPPPPSEFTRRVTLRRAYLSCALSEVAGENLQALPPRPPRFPDSCAESGASPAGGKDGQSVDPESDPEGRRNGKEAGSTFGDRSPLLTWPWCRHRADVRLVNVTVRMNKKRKEEDEREFGPDLGCAKMQREQRGRPSLRLPTAGREPRRQQHDDGTEVFTPRSPEQDHDAEMTIGADLLEILVPAAPPRPPASRSTSPSPSSPAGSKDGRRAFDFRVCGARCREGGDCDGSPENSTSTVSNDIASRERQESSDTRETSVDRRKRSTVVTAGVNAATRGTVRAAASGERRQTWSGATGAVLERKRGGDKPTATRRAPGPGAAAGCERSAHNEGGWCEQAGARQEGTHGGGEDGGDDGANDEDHDDFGDDLSSRHTAWTKLVSITAVRYRRSLEWVPLSRQKYGPSPPSSSNTAATAAATPSSCSDVDSKGALRFASADNASQAGQKELSAGGKTAATASGTEKLRAEQGSSCADADSELVNGGVRGRLRLARLTSKMGIEVRAGHAAMTLPPHFQLGDLQEAAILQWKGVQEALGELSPSPPADACSTSVLLGGFTFHLEGEHLPGASATRGPAPPSPAVSPTTSAVRSLPQQRQAAVRFGNTAGERAAHGTTGEVPAPSLSRGSGIGGIGVGSRYGTSNAMPWQQHPRAMIRSLRQSGASLSSFLGLSGSGSDLSDSTDADNAGSRSRRSSVSPSAADRVPTAGKNLGGRMTGDGGDGEGGAVPRDGGSGVGGGRAGSRRRGTDDKSDTGGAYGVGGADEHGGRAAANQLAVLSVGEISFELSRKEPQRSLLAAVRQLDEHPGPVTYGQAMGGWGRLSLSSIALYLDGLSVAFATAENVGLEGLFARAAIAGTDTTRRHDYCRLSSSSPNHPIARAVAAAGSTTVAAAAAAAAASAGCRFAHDRKRSAVVGGEAGEDEGRRSEAEVVLLLPLLGPEAGVGGDTGNGRDWDSGGGGGGDVDTVMENHVGFAVQSAGTAGKLYGDLEGSVVGVTLVHGACLNAAVMKLVEALVRLQPSSSNESEGKYAPAEAAAAAAATPYEKGGVQFPVRRPPAGCDLGASTKVVGVPIPSSTKRGKQRHSAGEAEDEDAPKNKEGDENRKQKEKARGEAEGCGGQEQQRQLSEEASAEGTTCAQGEGRQDDRSWGRTSSPPPIQAAGRALTSKPHVEFWDKLRCLLHGNLRLNVDNLEVTALLDCSPVMLGASLRLLVSKAKVAYTPGHLDLNLRHALLSTPSKPPLEVLHDEDLPAGNTHRGGRNSSRCSPRSSLYDAAVSAGPTTGMRRSFRHQVHSTHRNGTPSSSSGLNAGGGIGDLDAGSSSSSSLPFTLGGSGGHSGYGGGAGGVGGRDARSATVQVPSASATVVETADAFLPGAPTSPVLGKQQRPRQEEKPYQHHNAGRGSCPSLLPTPTSARDPCFGGGTLFGEYPCGRSTKPAKISSLFGSRHSVAFVAEAAISTDFAWTCEASGGPDAHHLEINAAGRVGRRCIKSRSGAIDALDVTAAAAAAAAAGGSCTHGAPSSPSLVPFSPPARSTQGEGQSTLEAAATMAAAGDDIDMWAPYVATGLKLKISVKISPDTTGGGDGLGDEELVDKQHQPTAPSPASSPFVPNRRADSGTGLRASPLDGQTPGSMDHGVKGDRNARRPNSFPRRKRTEHNDGRDKEDDNVGFGFFRNYRHKRAGSDVPSQPQLGTTVHAGLVDPAVGIGKTNRSGFLPGMLLTRSWAGSDSLQDNHPGTQAAGDGTSRGESADGTEMSAVLNVSNSDRGKGEARSERDRGGRGRDEAGVAGRDGEGGRGGLEEAAANVGTRGASGSCGQEQSRVPPPLTINLEGQDDPADGLFRSMRMPSTVVASPGILTGPASCSSKPSGTRTGGRAAFPVDSAQGPEEEHVFGRGFWVALRLDLLQWFLPLPAAAATPGDDGDPSPGPEGAESSGESTRGRTEQATPTASRKQCCGAETSEVVHPERVSILALVKSFSVSVDMLGLALATWRGAENRDGFVLDINRFNSRISSYGSNKTSGSSSRNSRSSGGRKDAEVRLQAVRLSRLHVASSYSGAGGGGVGDDGGEGRNVPQSPPTSGARRLSRLWIGRRQSSRGVRGTSLSPAHATSSKTTGLHRESIDLFASLDRSLSGAADKNAILRAERLVYRRKGKTAGAAGVIAGPEAAETTGGTFTGKNNTPGDSSLKKHRPLSPPPLPPRPSDKKSLSPREGRGASLAVARSGRGGADEGGTSGGGDSSPPVGSRDEGKDNAGHGQPAAATIAAAATPVAAMAVEDRPHQLKAVSSFFGNNVGRIRSAAKLAVPSSREPQQARGSDDGPVEAVTAITAASTDLAVDTTPARSPRRSFIQKVGLPRRRASCASPTARPPSELNSPPPLAPRPPRLVTATEGREPLAPSGGHKMVPLQQYVGAGDGSTAGATNLVVLDGLRLVWNLEIRDSVFKFISDAVESFSSTPCPAEPGEGTGDTSKFQDYSETTNLNSPGLRSPSNPEPNPVPGGSPSSSLSGKRRTSSFVSPTGAQGDRGGDGSGKHGGYPGGAERRVSAPEGRSPDSAVAGGSIGGGGGGGGDGGSESVNEGYGSRCRPVDLNSQADDKEGRGGDDGADYKNAVGSGKQSRQRVPPIAVSGGSYSVDEVIGGETGRGELGGGCGEANRSPSPHRLNPSPSRIDAERLGSADSVTRSPSAFVSPGVSSAGSDVSFAASPTTGGIFTPSGQGGSNDPNGLLDWLMEKLSQNPEENPVHRGDQLLPEDQACSSSGQATATAAASASSAAAAALSWPARSAGTPRGKGPSPPPSPKSTFQEGTRRRSNSPKKEPTGGDIFGGGNSVGGEGGGGVSGKEGWAGMPGKLHVDYEVHLKNPQIKLLGDSASLILYVEAAYVEARTCGTTEVVSSPPASPRSSAFRSSGRSSSLRRKEVKVKLDNARVFSLSTLYEGADRWVVHPSAARKSGPGGKPGAVAKTSRSWKPKPSAGAPRWSPTSFSRRRGSMLSPPSPSTSPTASAPATEATEVMERAAAHSPRSPPSRDSIAAASSAAAASPKPFPSPSATCIATSARGVEERAQSFGSDVEDPSDIDVADGGGGSWAVATATPGSTPRTSTGSGRIGADASRLSNDEGVAPSSHILLAPASSPPTAAEAAAGGGAAASTASHSPPSPSRFFKAPSRSKFVPGSDGGSDVGRGEGDEKTSKDMLRKGGSWFGRRGSGGGGRGHGVGDGGGGCCDDAVAAEEAGSDELREVKLTSDAMTVAMRREGVGTNCMPVAVDGLPSSASNCLIGAVMRLFSANALYLFHESLPARESHEYIPRASRHTTAEKSTAHKGNGRGGSDDGGRIGGGRDGLGVRRVNRPPVNKLRLDVPELSSDLDSSQFFEVLDVVKNLLLVPPPLELRDKVQERKRQRRAANCLDSEKVVGEEAVNLATEGKGGGLNINIRDKRRDYLKEVVEETLKSWNANKLSPRSTAAPAAPAVSSSTNTPPTTAPTITATAVASAATATATHSPPSPLSKEPNLTSTSAPQATGGNSPSPVASERDPAVGSAKAATDQALPVTPPRVRTGEEDRPVPTTTGGKPRELTRLEYRIGKCTWRLTMGSKGDQKHTADRRLDRMEVGLTGLSSTHNYLAEGGLGSGVVIENVMFQIERLWVRSLAPTTAARGARSGGTTSGKHKKGQGRAGNSAESCNGSQGRPSSPTSSSPVGAPSPLPPPPPRSDSSLSPTAASEAADDDRGASRDGGRVERTAYDSRSMLSPTLLYDVDNPCTTSACTSCKQNFVPEENAWNSCRFHCDVDGEDGVFVVDGVDRPAGLPRPAAGRIGRWSCCGKEDSSAAGCTPRPHKPKEIMISVRAEGGPSVLVGNTEVSVFKHLEVNIFPSIPYNLSINIRRDEAAALQHYFKLEAEADKEKDKAKSKKVGRNRLRLPSRKASPKADSNTRSSVTNAAPGGEKRGSTAAVSIAQPVSANDGFGGAHGDADGARPVPTSLEHQESDERRALVLLLGKRAAGSAASTPPTLSPSASHAASAPATAVEVSGGDEPHGKEKDEEEHQDHEKSVFLKYVRFGAARLMVSTTGYKFVRLRDFPVLVNPYVRHGKMTDWKRLTNKCVWRMVRHTTRSGLSQLKHAGVFGRISGGGASIARELLPARPGQQRPDNSSSGGKGIEGGGISRWPSPKNRARRSSEEVKARGGGGRAARGQNRGRDNGRQSKTSDNQKRTSTTTTTTTTTVRIVRSDRAGSSSSEREENGDGERDDEDSDRPGYVGGGEVDDTTRAGGRKNIASEMSGARTSGVAGGAGGGAVVRGRGGPFASSEAIGTISRLVGTSLVEGVSAGSHGVDGGGCGSGGGSVDDGARGGKGGSKNMSVAATFRRRLRSGTGSKTDVVSAEAAATAAVAEGKAASSKEDEPGGAKAEREGIGDDDGRRATVDMSCRRVSVASDDAGVAGGAGRSASHSDRDHDRGSSSPSSCSSSSSSRSALSWASSLLHLRLPPPPDLARQTPDGNRTSQRRLSSGENTPLGQHIGVGGAGIGSGGEKGGREDVGAAGGEGEPELYEMKQAQFVGSELNGGVSSP